MPTYDELFFGTAGDPHYALSSDAAQVTHTFRDLRRFWDIESGDIQLMAMNGESLPVCVLEPRSRSDIRGSRH